MPTKIKKLPPNSELHRLFRYDDGKLIRRVRTSINTKIGDVAGCRTKGYVHISIGNIQYLAHRIIFQMRHGYCPDVIDHIDGNGTNNRIENLQGVTASQNQRKQRVRETSASGRVGVAVHHQSGRWQSRIYYDGKDIYLGLFASLQEAIAARDAAEIKYFGAVIGRPLANGAE